MIAEALDLLSRFSTQKALANLRREGWTHERIARRVGVSHRAVSSWADGTRSASIKWRIRLLDLHLDVCPDRHDGRLVA